MSNLDVDGFEDFFKTLDKLGESATGTAKKAIAKATPVLQKSVRSTINSIVGPKATGELARSFVPTDPKENKYGVYSTMRPVGRDKKGVEYAKMAAFLEYGTPYRIAKPYIDSATKKAKSECESVMQKVFDEEIEKIAGR